MPDDPYSGPERRSEPVRPAGEYDVVRVRDLSALEARLDERTETMEKDLMEAVTANTRAVGELTHELAAFRAEQNTTWVAHHGEHAAQSADWERRWNGVAVDMAYRRGLIALPRMVLEWLRLYLAPISVFGLIAAVIIGLMTGNVAISVGP